MGKALKNKNLRVLLREWTADYNAPIKETVLLTLEPCNLSESEIRTYLKDLRAKASKGVSFCTKRY